MPEVRGWQFWVYVFIFQLWRKMNSFLNDCLLLICVYLNWWEQKATWIHSIIISSVSWFIRLLTVYRIEKAKKTGRCKEMDLSHFFSHRFIFNSPSFVKQLIATYVPGSNIFAAYTPIEKMKNFSKCG